MNGRTVLRFLAGPVGGFLTVFNVATSIPDPTGITTALVILGGTAVLGTPLGVAFATERLHTKNTLIVLGAGQIIAFGLFFVVGLAMVVPAALLRAVDVGTVPFALRALSGLLLAVGGSVAGIVVAHRRFLDDGETLRIDAT